MQNPIIAMLWPDEENFLTYAAICDDETAPDLQTFRQDIRAKLARKGISEQSLWKIAFDPLELKGWCLRHGCKVDTQGRAQYAAFLAQQRHSRAK